jgi:hypothetical protein
LLMTPPVNRWPRACICIKREREKVGGGGDVLVDDKSVA